MSTDRTPVGQPTSATRPRQTLTQPEFARLFHEHWRVLWCAAVGVLGDRTGAQDVVQEAAVVALQRLEQFDAGTSFVAWMVQIVRNLALNESRKRTRRKTMPTDNSAIDMSRAAENRVHAPSIGSRGQIMQGEEPFDDDLLRALGTLDETVRGCLLLRSVLDMPYREIAQSLNIPEGTAASHVHRARTLLRNALRQHAQGGVR